MWWCQMVKLIHRCTGIDYNECKLEYDEYWHDDWVLLYGDYSWEYISDINFCPFCGEKLG